MFTEDITSVVVDPGSLQFKSGYSGDDTPRVLTSSYFGTQQSMEIEGDYTSSKNMIIEDQAIRHIYQGLDIQHSYYMNKVSNKDAFVEKVRHIYKQLGVLPTEYSLLMSENSIHDTKERELLTELAFESLHVPNFFVCKQSVLSSFSSGKSTALVLDSGAYQTFAVPVFDGYCLQKAIVKFDIGGEFLTQMIKNNIEINQKKQIKTRYEMQSDFDLSTVNNSYREMSVWEIVRDIKENVCKVDEKGLSVSELQLERQIYELPDGQSLLFDSAKFEYCEYFFSRNSKSDQASIPDFLQKGDLMNFKGVQHMTVDAINQCDIDIKRELFQNIILTGGNSLLSGFSSKLHNKLNDVMPPNSKVKFITFPTTIERKFSSWIGGSILASLGSFQSLWITKQEYEESGSYIVEKKCS